ncbi:MAG: hypothetical protein JJE28_02110 [Actinomycetales bacterium]|nr:hypothetical protein [Actinomycetales bacterium]
MTTNTTAHAPLVMTMSDIAALAHVQRPVVSVWRSRASQTDRPFPEPISQRGDQQLFDAAEIGQWLDESQYGNNPNAAADAAAHAVMLNSMDPASAPANDVAGDKARETFNAVTALLALRRQLGMPLTKLRAEPTLTAALLDAADDEDLHDDSFYSELEAVGDDLASLAIYVDALVESAYGEAPAFERVLADRVKRDGATEASTSLSPAALHLMSEAATALADSRTKGPFFVDAFGSASDILLAIANVERITSEVTVLTADELSAPARLMRRRLLTHGIRREGISADASGNFTASGPAVHVAQFPSANQPVMTSSEILDAIDRVVMGMTRKQTAVMLAPASVLTDALSPGRADDQRSAILRSRRLRAIIRLPAGLLAHKPQQAQALWVFAAAHENVPLADLWTLVADLTETSLDSMATQDLVSDLVASLGDEATVRSHAFRFARLVPTRVLLASRNSLVAAAVGVRAIAPSPTLRQTGAEMAVRASDLIAALAAPKATTALNQITVEAAGDEPLAGDTDPSTTPSTTATIEQLAQRRHLLYIPGNRLAPEDSTNTNNNATTANATAGLRLIGSAELLDNSTLGHRSIDSIRFVTEYPAGRLTEPGDIVFCTSPRPAAMIDTEGTSVVVFPARILRINYSSPNGLLAEIIAADINAQQPGNRRWRQWMLRRVRPAEGPALAQSLAAIRSQQAIARARLTQLDELASLLMAGTTAGTLTLTTTSPLSPTESLAPPKGTP